MIEGILVGMMEGTLVGMMKGIMDQFVHAMMGIMEAEILQKYAE